MAKLKDEALNYESHAVGNIADLPKVSTDIEVVEATGTGDDGKEFTYKMTTIDGADYRVPNSVLKQLKAILEDNPNLKEIRVKKTGNGMSTAYQVIPLA